MKKTITAIALTALLGSSVPIIFAQTTTMPTPAYGNGKPERMMYSSTTKVKEEKKGEKREMKKIDPMCMQNAVEKRETSLITALNTKHTSVITAHTVRKDALKAAFLLPTKKEVNDARTLANKNFESVIKSAQSGMKTTREVVWPTFRTDVKACGQVEMERATVAEMSL